MVPISTAKGTNPDMNTLSTCSLILSLMNAGALAMRQSMRIIIIMVIANT